MNNNISSIPTEIGYMSGLQSLHLGELFLFLFEPHLPAIAYISSVETNLFSGHNNVASIPTEIGLMKHLTVLDFSEYLPTLHGQVIFLNTRILIPICSNLSKANNNISSIPTEIGLLSNLEFLSFGTKMYA